MYKTYFNKFSLKALIKPILLLLFTTFLFGNTVVFANDETKKEESTEKFNAGELILDHIGDAHEWHIVLDVYIPLPVILYVEGEGLKVFSSSHFEHGKATYEGFASNGNHIVAVNSDGKLDETQTAKIWDISITKNTATILFSVFIMLFVFLSVAKAYKRNPDKAPKGLQSMIEPIIVFVRDDIAKGSIGEKKYHKYMPFLLTIFFFIWITNMLGLIPIFPGGSNVTGNIAITMTLAVFTFIITTINANRHYWRHIFAMPGVPFGVLFIITPIEILGIFLKPFVLMIRLFANILAGHIVSLSFVCLIFIFAEINKIAGYSVTAISVPFMIFMMLLDVLVAFLQAYVFTLLSAIYFGAATEEHEHHPPHPDPEQQSVV